MDHGSLIVSSGLSAFGIIHDMMRSSKKGFEVQIFVILTIVTSILGGPRGNKPIATSELTHEFGPFITDFSIDIFKSLVKSSFNGTTSPENVIFSPSSAFRALLLLSLSAGDDSKSQLEKGLHIEGISEVGTKYKSWKKSKLKGVMEGDRLYRDKSVTIQDTFITLIGGDDIEEVDMSDAGTVGTINEWVSQITDDQISKFLDKIDPETKLILLSAINMKGEWTSGFEKKDVKQAKFTLSDRSTVTVPMMYKEDRFDYFDSESLKSGVVSLDYKDSPLKFVIFLPDEDQTIQKLVSLMSREVIQTAMAGLKAASIKFSLPKFQVEKKVDFVPLCKALGITDVFDPFKASISAFKSDKPLYVKEVLQKVVVNVDEKGTTAAAATEENFSVRGGATPFTCDRPFVYMIYDKSSGTPLFLGTMMNPNE